MKCISRHKTEHTALGAALGEVPVGDAGQSVRPIQRDIEHQDELIGVQIRKRSQQYRIHNTENRGIGADAQGESEHGYGGEGGRLSQYTKAVAQVLDEIVNPAYAAGVAALFFDLFYGSKFPQRHGPGFGLSRARSNSLLRELLDMNLNLALKFRVGVGTMQQ